MTTRFAAVTVVQYGIETPNSRTTIMVTDDLSEAQSTIDMLGSGTLVRRTVRYSPWRAVADGLHAAV
jgi:hypothetical protein